LLGIFIYIIAYLAGKVQRGNNQIRRKALSLRRFHFWFIWRRWCIAVAVTYFKATANKKCACSYFLYTQKLQARL